MPSYYNPQLTSVKLVGPDGRVRHIKAKAIVELPSYYDKYVPRYLIKADQMSAKISPANNQLDRVAKLDTNKRLQSRSLLKTPKKISDQIYQVKLSSHEPVISNQPTKINTPQKANPVKIRTKPIIAKITTRKVVGKRLNLDATNIYQQCIQNINYSISNNIGIGILSYNRKDSLKRLIDSIIKYTDLSQTTVFISDDNSSDPSTIQYLNELRKLNSFVILTNDTRAGIAGNSNRLLKCLSRFNHCLLLNDDVEVLNHGWDQFYCYNSEQSGIHHFCMRQPGVYGAKYGTNLKINGVALNKITDKPHGAVMYYTNQLFNRIGYFDEEFGFYGMEHVDWSTRAYSCGIQPSGFYDVVGSQEYFKIHKEPSKVENRVNLLVEAKKRFNSLPSNRSYISEPQLNIPKISYIVPYRNLGGRQQAICTVINNIRAQKFPFIEIIMVEQDSTQSFSIDELWPVQYQLAITNNQPFNKSIAFNKGVSLVSTDRLILHDADILIQDNYTSQIFDVLMNYEACHLGSMVVYLDETATSQAVAQRRLSPDLTCERLVGYFEGGSLACHKKAYWQVGGFNELFWGYGCEDTEFYNRLSKRSKWYENRLLNFIHLWHSRTDGWSTYHTKNKKLEYELKSMPLDQCVAAQLARIKEQYESFIDS